MLICNFDKAARSYEDYAFVQKMAAKKLMSISEGYANFSGKVLELGSGSGIFTKTLKKTKDNCSIICTDISFNFLKMNEESLKVNADILHLPFKNNSFSQIFSSSTLQWIRDFGMLLKELSRIGKDNLFFIFNLFLKGTFKEMKLVSNVTGFGSILEMKEIEYYLNTLSCEKFKVVNCFQEEHIVWFDSVKDFLTSHKNTGATVKANRAVGKRKYFDFVEKYENLYSVNNKIPVTYSIGYFISRKV